MATEKTKVRKVHYYFFDCLPKLQKGPWKAALHDVTRGTRTRSQVSVPHLRPACSLPLFCPSPANMLPTQYDLQAFFFFAQSCKQRAKYASFCEDHNSVKLVSGMRGWRSSDGGGQIGEFTKLRRKGRIF